MCGRWCQPPAPDLIDMTLHFPSFDLDLACNPILHRQQTQLCGQLWITGTAEDLLTGCKIRIHMSSTSLTGEEDGVEILPATIPLKKGKALVLPFAIPVGDPHHGQPLPVQNWRQLIRADIELQVLPESRLAPGRWQTATSMHALGTWTS